MGTDGAPPTWLKSAIKPESRTNVLKSHEQYFDTGFINTQIFVLKNVNIFVKTKRTTICDIFFSHFLRPFF
jgi:hypothetical protein